MNRLVAFGGVAVGAAIAFRCLPEELRHRLTTAIGHRVTNHMKKMMANLPDDAPPKLVMSILPKLRAQNDRIIALLQEQNQLLRERQSSAPSKRKSYV